MIEWKVYKQTVFPSHASLNDYFDSMKMLRTIENSKNRYGYITVGYVDDISRTFILGSSTNKKYLDILEDGKVD